MKLGESRFSAVVYDGAGVTVANLGLVAHGAGAVNGAYYTVPFDCYIAEAIISVGVLASSSAARAQIGTLSSGTAILTNDINNVVAGTVRTLVDDAQFASAAARKLKKGDIINLNTPAATAVGSVGATWYLCRVKMSR